MSKQSLSIIASSVAHRGSFSMEAGKLRDLLLQVVPKVRKDLKNRKYLEIAFKYDQSEGLLTVMDIIYNRSSVAVPHPCDFVTDIEIDGIYLAQIIGSYKPTDIVEIQDYEDRIEIVKGRSRFKMPKR